MKRRAYMSEHYYTKDPKVKSEPIEWSTEIARQDVAIQDGCGCV